MGTSALKWTDFKSRASWRLSPHLAAWQKKIVRQIQVRVPREPGMIWILSSGTQSVNTVKCIGLTYDAFMASAEAVNRHLEATKSDRWLLALPTFHVGGLSIYTRAHLSRSKVDVFTGKWSAANFATRIEACESTLTSLVPTQVFDLVRVGLRAPQSLRAAVIGGGALDPALYARARELGWPLLPSYGLTECCSQIATAGLDSLKKKNFPDLTVLSHAEIDLRDGRIYLKAHSMCRWVATGNAEGMTTLQVPFGGDGWLRTEDLAEWRAGRLHTLGRRDDVVKVLGELVPVPEIEAQARTFFEAQGLKGDIAVLALPHARQEHELLLLTDSPDSLLKWTRALEKFNADQPGVRRLSGPCWIEKIPRGDLGKFKKGEMRRLFHL